MHYSALSFVNADFEHGQFKLCLEDIQIARASGTLTPLQRAETLFVEGMCYEEMGRPLQAETNYVVLIKEFPQTSFAERAQRRLLHQDPDQREHLELSFGEERWWLVEKTSGPGSFTRYYKSHKRGESVATVSSFVGSEPSLEFLMRKFKAEIALVRPDMQWTILSSDEDETYMSFRCKTKKECGVVRAVRTESFWHTIIYSRRGDSMSPEENEKWLKLLRKAWLEPAPVKKPEPKAGSREL